MELLVCVINQEDKLDEILSRFLELGITGATVIDSEGMGRHITGEAPVFAGLQTLIARSRPRNKTILSVIDSPERRDHAIQAIQEIIGHLDEPGTGIVCAVPVTAVVGLAPKLE